MSDYFNFLSFATSVVWLQFFSLFFQSYFFYVFYFYIVIIYLLIAYPSIFFFPSSLFSIIFFFFSHLLASLCYYLFTDCSLINLFFLSSFHCNCSFTSHYPDRHTHSMNTNIGKHTSPYIHYYIHPSTEWMHLNKLLHKPEAEADGATNHWMHERDSKSPRTGRSETSLKLTT